jgi:signal transduction histidine kinase
MATIIRQSESLSGMVTQLLDVSRINDGLLTFKMERVALAGLVQETMAECAHLSQVNLNSLRLAPGGAHPTVIADRSRLNRILINLITNSARHTHEGSIVISVAKEDGFARVTVQDTGEGMTEEQIAAVFLGQDTGAAAPGSRLHDAVRASRRAAATPALPTFGGVAGTPDDVATAPRGIPLVDPGGAGGIGSPTLLPVPSGSRHGGLGLGLRLVRHMVAAQGGSFELTSEVGVGTTGSFTVPLAFDAAQPVT